MRRNVRAALAPVAHDDFLVYVMGPYKAFTVEDLLPDGASPDDLDVSFTDWDSGSGEYTEAETRALLERTRDRLRDEAGLNAFLATDVDVPLAEMDAATQTIRFARASNVIAFVAPQVGMNLGVGIETGAVLEALSGEDHERVVFVHEDGVRSAMIDSVSRRWTATVYDYESEDELVKRLRQFAADVMNREYTGDLDGR